MSTILLVLAGVLFTSFLSGIIGMAGDALLLVITVFLLPVHDALAVCGVALFFASVARLFIHRQHINKKSIEYYLVGLLFAFIFGALPTLAIDKDVKAAFTGAEYILLGLAPFVIYFSRGKFRPDFSQPPQALVSAVIGESLRSVDMAGLSLHLFFQNVAMTRYEVVATRAASQFIPSLARLVHIDTETATSAPLVWIVIMAVPLAFLGSWLGKQVLKKVTDEQFYKITQIVLWVIGAVYLWTASLLFMPAPSAP